MDPEKLPLIGEKKAFGEKESASEDCCYSLKVAYHRVCPCYFLIVIFLMTLLPFASRYWFPSIRDLNALDSSALPDKARIYLHSLPYQLYVRSLGGVMLLSEDIPWQYGSSLEVHRYDEQCFQLKTSSNTWLRMDASTSELRSDGLLKIDGAYFSALAVEGAAVNISSSESQQVLLKLCGSSVYFEAASSAPSYLDNLPTRLRRSLATANNYLTLKAVQSFAPLDRRARPPPAAPSHPTSPSLLPSAPSPALFSLQILPQIRGVNLGGWFIPEVWMNRDFYEGSGLGWGGSLCRLVNFSLPLAEQKIQTQLKTWITERDFAEITSVGFNSVRLPVGYWNLIRDPYALYAPQNLSLSLQYIDFAFNMALKYNLSLLLDLHGAPGSQNGIDHSGCSVPPRWLGRRNLELTVQAVQAMAERYGAHPALLGFELMNEPGQFYSNYNHSTLVQYYQKAYQVIRKYNKKCLVVFNELYEVNYKRYAQDLLEPDYYNVLLDMHLYNWQSPYTLEPKDRHVSDANNWAGLIETFSVQHPILIGEWCMSTGTFLQAKQPFVSACVESFKKAAGWYLWNWKIQRGLHFDEWDVQYQYSLEDGLRPL